MELIIVALIFGILLRVPLIFFPAPDNWGFIGKVRQHVGRRWLTHEIPESVVPGIFPYPMFLHFIVSKFPEKAWWTVAFLLNVIPDIIYAVAVFFVTSHLLSVESGLPLQEARGYGFIATCLYISLPVLMPITSRMKATNGRAFGSLPVGLYFCSIGVFFYNQQYIYLALAFVFAFMTCVTSLFGLQVLFFFSICFSILYTNPTPILICIFLGVLGWFVPQLGLRDIFAFKLNHFLWYRRNRRIMFNADNRNLFINILKLPIYALKEKHRVKRILFFEAPLLIAAYSIPPAWLLLYVLISFGTIPVLFENSVIYFCGVLFTSSVIVFLITSTRWFSEWGESERYLEYSAPALVILAVVLGVYTGAVSDHIFYTLLAIHVLFLFILHWCNRPERHPTSRDDSDRQTEDRRLQNFLEDLPGKPRIATYPIQMSMLLRSNASPNSRLRFYFPWVVPRKFKWHCFADLQDNLQTIDLFRHPVERLMAKYAINCVVVRNDLWRQAGPFVDSLAKLNPVYKTQKYSIFTF